MAEFQYYSLADAHLAEGVVVVIDVLRAFTTAAYALANGARKIYPVRGVEEALTLRLRMPGSLIMGEMGGFKPAGFDFSNSPAEIKQKDLDDRILIQRTSAGTQGISRTMKADHSFVTSFVIARATAVIIRQLNPDLVSFIVTGKSLGRDGDEDLACGEYIETLIKGQHTNPNKYLDRVDTSTVGQSFLNGELAFLSDQDFELSKKINRFGFFLPVHKERDLLVIEKGVL